MVSGWARTARYVRAWGDPNVGLSRVASVETAFDVEGQSTPGTVYVPKKAPGPLPAWVALHGVTVPGRSHDVLQRFARALASSPAVVFTPEIPAWSALNLDPERSLPTVQSAVLEVGNHPAVDPDRVGVIGFSFGSPQALIASTSPALEGKLRAVVGFGGYCDLARVLAFLFGGWHEWQGEERYQRPDPYGRWIVGANYLTEVPEWSSFHDLRDTLKELAVLAGQRRIASWDPAYDPVKNELASKLPDNQRALFRRFAPPANERVDRGEAERIANAILSVMRSRAPKMDPVPWLQGVSTPVHLIHGRSDALIPFTETLRMRERLLDHTTVKATVTRLFAHSAVEDPLGPVDHVREQLALARALNAVLGSV